MGNDYDDSSLLQRYAAATLFFATNGPTGWAVAEHWLSNRPLCDWYRVSVRTTLQTINTESPEACRGDNLTDISLSTNNLSGSLPKELGLLTHLQKLELLGNKLTGTLPTSLGWLSKMERFSLGWNQLEGTFPPEYGAWTSLVEFRMAGNEFEGFIPSNYASSWPRLDIFHVEHTLIDRNALDEEFCQTFLGIYELWADCSVESCTCCTQCCDSTSCFPPFHSGLAAAASP